MPTPTKGARLGGSPAHQRLMLGNLATALFTHGRITTTEAKAKRLRPFAERLITKSRKGDLHNRREILKVIRDKDVVHKLFAEIGPHFAERQGGYTRITKTMPRKGDNAPMAVIELVLEKTVTAEAEAARKGRVAASKKASITKKPKAAAPKDETPAAVEVDDEPAAEAVEPAETEAEATAPEATADESDSEAADEPAAEEGKS